jgi:hypothetical protein
VFLLEKKVYFTTKTENIKEKVLYGFDIETFGKNNDFLMGSIVGNGEVFTFWNKEDLQDFILSDKFIDCFIVASNLAFDFLALFGSNIDIISKFRITFRGSDFISCVYNYHSKHKTGKITFIDTFNYLKASVESLGKIIGESKLSKPKHLGKFVKQDSIEGNKLEIYNIKDAEISFKFMQFMQKEFNKLGVNIKFTAPSTSLNLFRCKYMDKPILQPNKEILKTFYNSYYGGRCETFIRGTIKEKLFYYDINSLYPTAMHNNIFPFPNSIEEDIKLNMSLNDIYKYEGISLCNVIIDKNIIPFLPYRNEEEKLIFPLGTFKGWYSHAELKKAISLGYKIELLQSIIYKETHKPFIKYVDDLYNLRKEFKKQNNPAEVIVKLALNSLYGKYAQKMNRQEILFLYNVTDCKKYDDAIEINKSCPYDKPRYNINIPNDKLPIAYIEDTETEVYPKFINPVYSVYVTSYSRIMLYEFIEKVLLKGGKVFYCDTDSIITNISLNEYVGIELGQLKEELVTNHSIFIKPKFYYMEDITDNSKDKIKSKGMRNIKDFLAFEEMVLTKEYTYTKFTKFKESIRRDLAFNEKIEVKKMLNIEDNKRLWDKPFNINEVQESKPLWEVIK